MISKNQISNRAKRKKNIEIIEIINLAKKKNFLELAKKLSAPRSQYKNINLDELERLDKDNILVVGKVLGSGNINKSIKIIALDFSEQAREKLKKANCNTENIKIFLDKNSKLEGVTII